jgi:hypothetical protein
MSKAKAIKKPKNEKLRADLKLLLYSFFNNDACVEGRQKPWYFAVTMAILSVFVAIIPIATNNLNKSGSDILSSPTYGMENGLVAFQESLDTNNISFEINGSKNTLTVDNDAWTKAYATTSGYFSHKYTKTVTYTVNTASNSSSATTDGEVKTKTVTLCDLAVYNLTTDNTILTNNDFTSAVTKILNASDCLGNSTYSVNSIFFWTDSFYVVKLPSGASSSSSTLKCYYYGNNATFNLKDLVKEDTHGNAYSVPSSAVTKDNIQTYVDSSIAAWKGFFADEYNVVKVSAAWQYVGIISAVFVGVIFFMGLMVFIMTRGKENPYRIYTFWQTQKIAYWASLSPALLAMILTFIWPSFSLFYFIFLFGLRVMWMSMRSLRPYQQQQ